MDNEIIIPLSKGKIVLLIIGSLAFVTACAWLFNIKAGGEYEAVFWKGFAIIGGIFFSITGIFGIKKIFDFEPGLVINSEGIIDNSSAVSIGLIKWGDIVGFKVMQISSTKLLLILVKNPEKYIEMEENKIKRKLMSMNNSRYGSPISISSNALKINFKELEKMIQDNFEKYSRNPRI